MRGGSNMELVLDDPTQGQIMDAGVGNVGRQKERGERGKRRTEREVDSSS